MSSPIPTATQPNERNPQRQSSSAGGAEARGVPESSLLFSPAMSWIPEAEGVRRNSGHSRHLGVGWVGVAPTISIATAHPSIRSPTSSELFSDWRALSLRDQVQLQTPPLSSQLEHNFTSFAIPLQSLPRNGYQLNHIIDEAHTTTTHVVAPPLVPPPCRRAPIALPSLSPFIPIKVHPIISYYPSTCDQDASIHWNMTLPPSTARLAAALGGLTALRWSREAAVEPGTLSSMTIHIAGIERPVVVFPAEMAYPIRITDVLSGVYGALRRAALESVGGLIDTIGAGGWSRSGGSVAIDEAATADAIRNHFHGEVWWCGLHKSTNERDVWILEFRDAERSWY